MTNDRDRLSELAKALHRKLINLGHDIRAARKHKASDEEMTALILRRKVVDRAYSKCTTASDQLEERQRIYSEAIKVYWTY